MELFIILVVGYTASYVTFGTLKRVFKTEAMKSYVISADPERGVDSATLHRSVKLNSMVSSGFMIGCCLVFSSFLIYTSEVALWRIPLEIAVVIVIYDFIYYAVHRYPFHEWKMLREVHAVHHQTRHPRGVDSLLLHPAETCIGLGAFLISVALIGGVHYLSFAVLFIGYTTLNVINHAGLNFQRFPLRIMGWLAVKHDKHHRRDFAGNYAFLTTIPDTLFGTAE
ncbi:MAG: sterol desaturase family protein [bacterium]|nr:sterol desaturase family protein [bacterium]